MTRRGRYAFAAFLCVSHTLLDPMLRGSSYVESGTKGVGVAVIFLLISWALATWREDRAQP